MSGIKLACIYSDTETALERYVELSSMIDFVDPDERFDAVKYAKLARGKVAQLDERGILPFVVGGTGLYIKSLLHGMFQSQVIDPAIRARLTKQADDQGSEYHQSAGH